MSQEGASASCGSAATQAQSQAQPTLATLPTTLSTLTTGSASANHQSHEDFDPFSASGDNEMEEQELALSAPPDTEWYHGRLDRTTSESRLEVVGKKGCYLVRVSDRRPDNYVLCHLGLTGINHFRITAVCGDYYIGGRQFTSLGSLIGYYTDVSDLLKGEHLEHPVPPPQPVADDKRHVVTIVPYTKMVETDELSFEKGEVFDVENELADGWLWVYSPTRKESGLVYAGLTEEQSVAQDPVERLPFYFPNVTTQEAVDRLTQAGESSFLVRPSENSPPHLSLFFYVADVVQRFRIERVGDRYVMGGRYFLSVDEIINRYKKEAILEGHKLKESVVRDDVINTSNSRNQSEDEVDAGKSAPDVYSSMKRSAGANLYSRGNDTPMKGFLHKKSSRHKKWKGVYFVLHGLDNQLLYFESEKRSKPKGLIDLSYASWYPVHDSLLERPHCFQLIVKGLSDHSVYYLCAETLELQQDWSSKVAPLCVNSGQLNQVRTRTSVPVSPPLHTIAREVRTLDIRLMDARRLPLKGGQHAYVVVSGGGGGGAKLCRTPNVDPLTPVWTDEYTIENVPSDVDSLTFTLMCKNKRSKDIEIGSATRTLESLRECDDSAGECLALSPGGSSSQGASLRVTVKFNHTLVLPADEYAPLHELLCSRDEELLLTLASVCGNDRVALARSLLHIYRALGREAQLVTLYTHAEIARENDPTTLFRASSFATTVMEQLLKTHAVLLLRAALQQPIDQLLDYKNQTWELSSGEGEQQEQQGQVELIMAVLHNFSSSILDALQQCPTVVRQVCWELQQSVAGQWPDNTLLRTRVVNLFLFLRFLCPAIINPKGFGLCTEVVEAPSQRGLLLVTKCLQSLANLVELGSKEPRLVPLNPFIQGNKQRIIAAIDQLASPCEGAADESPAAPALQEVAPHFAQVHQVCETNLDKLKARVKQQPMIRRLVAVTEILTKHKMQYMGTS